MDLPPHIFLNDQTRPVAPPVASRPSGALVEELHAVLQSRLKLTFSLILDPGFPLVTDEPSCDKVVVVGIENVVPPLFPLKAVKELCTLQNLRAVGAGASRHARRAAIDVVGGGDLKVAALNVSGTQPVEDARLQVGVPLPANSLACSHATNLGVLKRSQDPRHQGLWPFNVVICHDGDGGPDVRQCSTHLHAFVCNVSEENTDPWVVQRVCELFQVIVFGGGGDKDELVWLTGQNALERGAKFFHAVVYRGNHNSHIIGSECWFLWNGLGLVGPVADAVDEKTDVTVEPDVC